MLARALTLAVCCAATSASAATVLRGPFLQLADPTSITVVLRTDLPGTAVVRYGTSPSALTGQASETSPVFDHVVRLTGLTPATRYWYRVEMGTETLASGTDLSFRTYPTVGSQEPFRFIAWGDSGNGSGGQIAVANRMAGQVGEPAFGLILGDIIYPDGSPLLYDPYYFIPYRDLLKRMVIWPTIGNHDIGFDNGDSYLAAYTLPTNNPAGSELYYSFDYGNAHFVCLDTHRSSFAAGSPQLQWAAQDLAASTARWKFVYFHVPPYTGGTHSDSASVQSNILPVLDAANVDMVFAGHSHVYERTYLLRSNSIVQSSPNSYTKLAGGNGALYLVSGTAGQSGGLSLPNHPLMAVQRGNVLGNTVIDVSGPVARGYFLYSDGRTDDLFTLFKDTDTQAPKLIGVRAGPAINLVTLVFDEPLAAGTGAGGAENPANYTIMPAVAVMSATLGTDQRTVTLGTAPHPNGSFMLTVSNVLDRATPAANAVAPGTMTTYAFGQATDGGTMPVPDAGQPGDAGTDLPLFARAGAWRYVLGAVTDPTASWAASTFDDTVWPAGRAPIGYGEPGLGTTVPTATISLYARAEFDLFVPPAGLSALALRVQFDDGFVAYLNGVEVARRNVAAGATRFSFSSTDHEASSFETFNISAFINRLVPGDNYLAIEVHNTSLTSSDLYLDAELAAVLRPVPPPYVTDAMPADQSTGVAPGSLVSFHVHDDTVGVEPPDITLLVDGANADVVVTGTMADRVATHTPVVPFMPGATVQVEVNARNRNGVAMAPYRFSFQVAPGGGTGGGSGGGSGGSAGGAVGTAGGSGGTAGGAGGGGMTTTPSSCRCDGGGGAALLLGALALVRRRRVSATCRRSA